MQRRYKSECNQYEEICDHLIFGTYVMYKTVSLF